MIKRICDRCNNEIQGNNYYIDIYAKEDNYGMMSVNSAANNVKENIKKMFNTKNEYCEKCIEEIKKYIEKVIKEEQ